MRLPMRKPWSSPFLFSSNSKKSRKCSSRVCHCERMGGKLSSHCLIFLNFIYAVAMDKIVLCKKNLRFFLNKKVFFWIFFAFLFPFLFLRLSVIFPECLCSDGCLDLLCCGELPVILSTRVIYFFSCSALEKSWQDFLLGEFLPSHSPRTRFWTLYVDSSRIQISLCLRLSVSPPK